MPGTLQSASAESTFPQGDGVAALIRGLDWSQSPLGPISTWSPILRGALSLILPAQAQIVMFWGPEFAALYNDAYAPTIGNKHPHALGRPARDYWSELWDDLEPLLLRARSGETVVAKDRPFQIERRGFVEMVYFDISYSPARGGDGSVEGVVCIVAETTERVLAAQQLSEMNITLERKVEERTRERNRIWETTNDLMGTAGIDGFLKAVNPAWNRTLGWSEHELLDAPFWQLVARDDHAATEDIIAKLASGEMIADFVNRILQKDGNERIILWNAVPEGDRFHVVGRDVTEQRAIEEQLRQSQKMEAVGQLTGGLAHDFNNLLAGITGALDLMRSRLSQGRLADVQRYIIAAHGAAGRAAALTHRLLAFSRRQTLEPKPTDVNRLIAQIEDLLRRTLGPSIGLEIVGTAGLWTARVDQNQLENAILNLCINARDAMPNGGRVIVETANKWLDERGGLERDLAPGQYISVCVSDTGVGMSADIQKRAFDPFFTTKPLGQGTGLGLSMIYGFARQSGGQVRIYSVVDEGTTMCIYLPRYYGDTVDDGPSIEPSVLVRARDGEAVLIVDDEPTVRLLVTEVLEDLGYTAIEANDGPSGLRILQSDARIDLLITDVGLPGGLNGRQMADAALAARPNLKVLFITGYAENAAVGNGHLSPGMEVLAKPFPMTALASRIQEMIGRR